MGRPTTALIVDDEPHVRVFLRLVLAEAGIATCDEAADGATALAAIQKQPPGLVLLDINMPGTGGVAVLEKIAAIDPEIPVVIVTAQSAITTVKEAMRLGAAGYILKQTPRAEMVGTLRELIESLAEDEAG
jgi:two-component system chemotaxis response regulator CheY